MTGNSNYIELDFTNLKNTKFVPIPEALKKISESMNGVMKDIDRELGIEFWCRPETIRVTTSNNYSNGEYLGEDHYGSKYIDSYSLDNTETSVSYFNKAIVNIHSTYFTITVNEEDNSLVDIKTSEGFDSFSYGTVEHVLRSDGKLHSYMDKYAPVTKINEVGITPEQAVNKLIYAILTYLSPRSCCTIEVIADIPN